MIDLKNYVVSMKIFMILMMSILFLSGNMIFYLIVYLLIFLFMVVRTLVVPSERKIKAYLLVVYSAILAAQLVLNTLVTFGGHHFTIEFYFFRLVGVLLILFPIFVERFVTINKYAKFYMPSARELGSISFSELKLHGKKIHEVWKTFDQARKSLSAENLQEIVGDLPRHSSFQYISKGSLTNEYFQLATAHVTDPYIYIVISNTGSPASEIISTFTQKQYNHASLAFDHNLETIISYNGGERVYAPGLNHEMIEYFNKKDDASIIVYRLPCTQQQKQMLIDKVKEINTEGSAYNLMGLILRHSHKPNIMFCSQFVYKMLQHAGLAYFDKKDGEVKPTDLVELDYYRKLEFAYEIQLNGKEEAVA